MPAGCSVTSADCVLASLFASVLLPLILPMTVRLSLKQLRRSVASQIDVPFAASYQPDQLAQQVSETKEQVGNVATAPAPVREQAPELAPVSAAEVAAAGARAMAPASSRRRQAELEGAQSMQRVWRGRRARRRYETARRLAQSNEAASTLQRNWKAHSQRSLARRIQRNETIRLQPSAQLLVPVPQTDLAMAQATARAQLEAETAFGTEEEKNAVVELDRTSPPTEQVGPLLSSVDDELLQARAWRLSLTPPRMSAFQDEPLTAGEEAGGAED